MHSGVPPSPAPPPVPPVAPPLPPVAPPLRWTTPVRDYRSFGPRKVMTFGEARWEPTTGSFAYGEFQLQDIEYDVGLTK